VVGQPAFRLVRQEAVSAMAASESQVATHTGEEFAIDLPSTPSTGYLWGLAACPVELEAIPNKQSPPTGGAHEVGGTGVQVFRFRATAAGTYTITFTLKRPWETRSIDRRIFQVTVSA
jgi:predicted secreted protein